ncbi:Exostosin family protein [Prunus dulcis]|uniref:Exostosin family protein n=1 Tax=Prunus dulcis TaxID=3755 RepID=A0A4Y1QNH0_PRUDU|nr:Exostosin family protein [Prunus dulcis]
MESIEENESENGNEDEIEREDEREVYSTLLGVTNGVNLLVIKQVHTINIWKINHTEDSCANRYIYIHEGLPARFNDDFLNNCESLINDSEGVLANKNWFKTNPYLLEVIFHNKMKRYECLTKNSSLASAIYVPFYPSMDVGVHLWDSNLTIRDSSARDYVKWLSGQPEWMKMRERDNSSDWGSKLRFLPESMNMTMLSIEGGRWKNDIAIPYPQTFILKRTNRVREQERRYLFSFVGAPRPHQQTSIRGKLIDHCQASTNCKVLHCNEKKCGNPVTVMRVFKSSVYCLQPGGDSYTRRSAFDAFLAGCIPVFFHPATAYTQYLWHLPKNHTKFSVFIPVRDVEDLKEGLIEKVLLGISKDKEVAMREEVIRLIPKLVYANPRSRLGTQDAFDIAVQGILERIENVRKVIRKGRDPSIGFADEDNDKFKFPETLDS